MTSLAFSHLPVIFFRAAISDPPRKFGWTLTLEFPILFEIRTSPVPGALSRTTVLVAFLASIDSFPPILTWGVVEILSRYPSPVVPRPFLRAGLLLLLFSISLPSHWTLNNCFFFFLAYIGPATLFFVQLFLRPSYLRVRLPALFDLLLQDSTIPTIITLSMRRLNLQHGFVESPNLHPGRARREAWGEELREPRIFQTLTLVVR